MSTTTSAPEQRQTPRFRSNRERLSWWKSECRLPVTSELLDVSEAGLAFTTDAIFHQSLAKGDSILVRQQNNRPAHYAVVWKRPLGERIAIGCQRVAPAAAY